MRRQHTGGYAFQDTQHHPSHKGTFSQSDEVLVSVVIGTALHSLQSPYYSRSSSPRLGMRHVIQDAKEDEFHDIPHLLDRHTIANDVR
jgi:hypothetical protein